jgi:hypothetical protein
MKQPLGFLRFPPKPGERDEQDDWRAAWQLLPPQVQDALRAQAAQQYNPQPFVEVRPQ